MTASLHLIDVVPGEGVALLFLKDAVFTQKIGNPCASRMEDQVVAVHSGIHRLDGTDFEKDVRVRQGEFRSGNPSASWNEQ